MLTRKRQQGGAVLYETLLSLPILLLFIFLGIKGMVLGYRALVLQYAAGQAVRKLAVGICGGPILLPDGSKVDSENSESERPCGVNDSAAARARFAYESARTTASRFGLKLASESDEVATNRLFACILPLNSQILTTNCFGSYQNTSGVLPAAGAGVSYVVLQLRTESGIRVPSLVGSSKESGPISGFDGSGTNEIRALAIARMERLN